jgi:hypothetical protein
LGILQGLARCGLLEKFHYLSTVSGGGYIGSWLSAWIKNDPKGIRGVVDELKSRTDSTLNPEPQPIRHLREFSNYLTPPAEPITGDSHHHLIARLIAHAEQLGYTVEIRELPEYGPGGWCDPKRRQIVVANGPANQQVRTLTHELAHAHGLGYATDPANDSNGTLPYIGVGYSSLAARSGWSFSADLGVVSQSPGNVVRFGRVFGGSQSLDDVIRDMRLAPVVQLGVSYSF